MKTQTIRLVDVFLLGPFMLWVATRKTAVPTPARIILGVSGIGTVVYNGINYLKVSEAERRSGSATAPI